MTAELTFDATQDTLETLLRELRDGRIQLPEFQRGWVWDDEHIRSLLTSVSRSFPVGAIMTLVAGGSVRFKTRPVEGVDPPRELPAPDRLLLDGQQRLTSLYQALRLTTPVRTRDAQKRVVRRWYYASIDKALGPAEEREQAVFSIPEDRRVTRDFGRDIVIDVSSRELELKKHMFPLNSVFDSDRWMMEWFQYWNHDPEKIDLFIRFKNEFIDAFKSYQIPIIQLRKSASKEAVCLIFEKVNTGGVPLTAFELLTATYAADGYDLREDWYGNTRAQDTSPGRARRMAEQRPLLGLVDNTEFLQAVSLIYSYHRRDAAVREGVDAKSLPPVSCTRQSILDLPLAAYRGCADAAEEGFRRAAQFLWPEKMFRPEDIPYRTQIVPLSVILYVLGPRWQEISVKNRVRQWYWCGVFGELYGSAIETRLARDTVEVVAWIIDDALLPSSLAECNFVTDRLRTMRTRLSAAYKGLHSLVMKSGGAKDLRTGASLDEQTYFEEAVDIHHIFPKTWCERQRIPWTVFDSVVNKTPLSATTNRLLGGDAPSLYLRRIADRCKLDDVQLNDSLQSHLVDVDALRADDFRAFILSRAGRLVELITQATGRPVGGRGLEAVFDFSIERNASDDVEEAV